jgi:phage-related minor tail protein
MTNTPENQLEADVSGGSDQTLTTTPEPTTPKFEIKGDRMLVEGKKVVYESDLIAAKKSLEDAMEKAQQAHNQAIDSAKLELSAAQQAQADLNAKYQALEQASKSGATPEEEVARIKQEAQEAATQQLGDVNNRLLELKRELLATKYRIPPDQLISKDMTQLDSFEEALKAITASSGGIGPYAVGGSNGGSTPPTDLDRAKQIISATPVRGVRNPPAE